MSGDVPSAVVISGCFGFVVGGVEAWVGRGTEMAAVWLRVGGGARGEVVEGHGIAGLGQEGGFLMVVLVGMAEGGEGEDWGAGHGLLALGLGLS